MYKGISAFILAVCMFCSGCFAHVEKINTHVGVVNHLFIQLFENEAGEKYFKMDYGAFHVYLISSDGKKYDVLCTGESNFVMRTSDGVVISETDLNQSSKKIHVTGASGSVIDIQFMCAGKEPNMSIPYKMEST